MTAFLTAINDNKLTIPKKEKCVHEGAIIDRTFWYEVTNDLSLKSN
jgi:hypothetical protein